MTWTWGAAGPTWWPRTRGPTLSPVVMRRMTGPFVCVVLLGAPPAAAQLPFWDDFEPPELALSRWTGTVVSTGNRLEVSNTQSFSGARALEFEYAGSATRAQALARLELPAPTTTVFA